MKSVIKSPGLSLVVNQPLGASSLALTIVRPAANLPSAMMTAYAYGDIALRERYINGVEVANSIIDGCPGSGTATARRRDRARRGPLQRRGRSTAGATKFFTPPRPHQPPPTKPGHRPQNLGTVQATAQSQPPSGTELVESLC